MLSFNINASQHGLEKIQHNHEHKVDSIEVVEKTYVCPMHPEVTSHEKGSCHICGMFLTEKKIENNENIIKETSKNNDFNKSKFKKENVKIDKIEKDGMHDKNSEIYICPMHPEITSHEKGSCPICGMNLELKKMNNASKIEVNVSGEMQQALGVRTFVAKKVVFSKKINTVGEVGYNEDSINNIYSRVDGWIEYANFQSIGDKIEKGDLLYTVYSPKIVQAQQDYLLALNSNISNSKMVESAKLTLLLLGVDNNVISKIKKENKVEINIPFYAKEKGVVTDIFLKKGLYINKNTKILSLVNFDNFWITVDLFENEQNWIRENQKVFIDSKVLDAKVESYIDYIYPELDKETRSLKARIIVPSGNFKPNMLVNVEIDNSIKKKAIMIPKESLIQTEKNNRVVVKTKENSFEVKEVVIGDYTNGMIEIKSGLKEFEKVVTSGQFLIDSESNIQGSISRMVGGNSSVN